MQVCVVVMMVVVVLSFRLLYSSKKLLCFEEVVEYSGCACKSGTSCFVDAAGWCVCVDEAPCRLTIGIQYIYSTVLCDT